MYDCYWMIGSIGVVQAFFGYVGTRGGGRVGRSSQALSPLCLQALKPTTIEEDTAGA